MILSRREEPPALILASRRSRRRRACVCVGDSSRTTTGLAGSVLVAIMSISFECDIWGWGGEGE